MIVALAFAAGVVLGLLAALAWSRRRGPAAPEATGTNARLRRIQAMAGHANDIMMLADEHHRLVEVNDRFCELLGYTREEALRLTIADLRDPATLEDLPLRKREQLETGGGLFETRIRRKDGTIFPVEVSVRVAQLEGATHFQAVVRDISDRKRMELRLQLADRMASVATLAAGVAHEVNDPLSFVLANVDFALSRLDHLPGELAEVRKALDEARGGADRVGQVVRDLRTFSRAGDAERQELDVRRALQSAVTMAQTEIRQRAQLSLELGPVPPVLANPHRVGQLFLNLLVNAAQAIPAGDPERHLVQATTSLAPDGRVRVEIADTGQGIAPEVLPRIFDPFFTTRAIGRGLGLGLAIAHGIVSDLGGEITVRSEPGRGSIFTVLLPPARAGAAVTPQPAGTPAPAAPPALVTAPVSQPAGAPAPAPQAGPAVAGPAAAPAGSAAPGGAAGLAAPAGKVKPPQGEVADILVIDDEPLVGRAITRMLAPPHRVVAVTSAAEALSLLADKRFDTIFCDLMMPDMTGMALYDRLAARARDQAERMVFLSGGAFAQEAIQFLQRVPNARLEKPFTSAELRGAVAALLAARRG